MIDGKECRVKYIGGAKPDQIQRISGVEEKADTTTYDLIIGENGCGITTDDPNVIKVQLDITWPFSHQWNTIPKEFLVITYYNDFDP